MTAKQPEPALEPPPTPESGLTPEQLIRAREAFREAAPKRFKFLLDAPPD